MTLLQTIACGRTEAVRPVRYVGRMQRQETIKRPGDRVWNSRTRQWEIIGND